VKNLILFAMASLLFSACSTTDLGNREPAAAKVPLNMKDEIAGLNFGNTHEVLHSPGRIIRGSEPPLANLAELAAIHPTDFVIFKADNKGEVAQEIQGLTKLFPNAKINHYAMISHDIKDDTPCQYTVKALNDLMTVARTPGRVAYFHCLHGEDRTGLLAGLLRMTTQGWSATKAFQEEMCAHGFGLGDTTRDALIGTKTEAALLPIFLQLASQIQDHGITMKSVLDPAMCSAKPKTPLDPAPFTCK
jgi:hypothetical protein